MKFIRDRKYYQKWWLYIRAIPAICTSDGKTEGSHCSVCGMILTAKNTIKSQKTVNGNVDGNGIIDYADARLTLRASFWLEKDIVKGTDAYLAADVDGNDELETADARLILRASVG